ncbi:MAG: hypothetical protein Q4G69_09905 [Planctomycetia bacterium]|nr:hypothetical protein [Planctomycetia bacterium]
MGILLIIALDLFRANAGFVFTVPYSFYHDKPLLVEEIEHSNTDPIIPPRAFRYVEWNPLALIDNSMRIQKGALWDRKTLAPKYSYPNRIGIASAQGTMMNRDYAVYLNSLKKDFARSYNDPSVARRFRDLGITYFVLPYRNVKNQEVKISHTLPVDRLMPRMYSFFDDPKNFFDLLDHDWPINTLLWKFQAPADRIRIGRKPLEGESVRITRFDPNRIEMDIHLKEPASVILAEQYWPEWKAEARSKSDEKTFSLPVYPENRIFRRLEMPAGEFSVVMEYLPSSFYWGALISLFTLFATIFCIFLKKKSFFNGKNLQIR